MGETRKTNRVCSEPKTDRSPSHVYLNMFLTGNAALPGAKAIRYGAELVSGQRTGDQGCEYPHQQHRGSLRVYFCTHFA